MRPISVVGFMWRTPQHSKLIPFGTHRLAGEFQTFWIQCPYRRLLWYGEAVSHLWRRERDSNPRVGSKPTHKLSRLGRYDRFGISPYLCGGAGGVEPLPAKRLSAKHCPCFITPRIKCHNFLNLVCRSFHLSPYCGGIRYIYPRGSLQNYILVRRVGFEPDEFPH